MLRPSPSPDTPAAPAVKVREATPSGYPLGVRFCSGKLLTKDEGPGHSRPPRKQWVGPDALFMMELLIAFAVVFGIGIGVGYAVRERKSRMRRRRYYQGDSNGS